jgi:hypothetical protein
MPGHLRVKKPVREHCIRLSRLQFDHRQRRQRMRAESLESQLHQAPVKSGARPACEHRLESTGVEAECPQPASHVDPIGSSEWLDEQVVIGVRGRDLWWSVIILSISAIQAPRPWAPRYSRASATDGAMYRTCGWSRSRGRGRPRRSRSFEVDTVFRNGGAQVHNAVYVVPIRDEVVPQPDA